jgi:hypothetical protein
MDHEVTLRAIVSVDPARMQILSLVRSLILPDCWVGAGFLRNAVWDRLHGKERPSPPSDVDVIWFETNRAESSQDQALETRLHALDASIGWSVKNQSRMHLRNGDRPYGSAIDAMKFWPETATAVAVRMNQQGDLEFCAAFGFDDLFDLIVRPTPRFREEKHAIYRERVRMKRWQETWPRLRIEDGDA